MEALKLVNTKDMPVKNWRQWRKKGIGGSDAPAVAGLNPWRSPMAVYLDKIGEMDDTEENERMEWGKALEPVIAAKFEERTGIKTVNLNAILQHRKYPFMLANIDRRVVGKREGLEIKTTSEWMRGEWEENKVPEWVAIQAHHYLAVTGYDVWHVAALIGGNRLEIRTIPRDEEIINYLVEIESRFWKLVTDRTPPPLDGSASSTEVISLLYPASEPEKEIELPPTSYDLIITFEEAQRTEKEAAERKEAAANQLKAMLGEAEIGKSGERKITWKTVTSNRLDGKALKKELPDIYSKFARESISRRFTVK